MKTTWWYRLRAVVFFPFVVIGVAVAFYFFWREYRRQSQEEFR